MFLSLTSHARLFIGVGLAEIKLVDLNYVMFYGENANIKRKSLNMEHVGTEHFEILDSGKMAKFETNVTLTYSVLFYE